MTYTYYSYGPIGGRVSVEAVLDTPEKAQAFCDKENKAQLFTSFTWAEWEVK